MRNTKFTPNEYGFRDRNPANRIFFGIAVALIGIVLLLKSLGILPFFIHFSWPVILIIIGAMIGLKNGFKNNAWWILITVGVVHLIPQFQIMGRSSKHVIWPAAVIVAGLVIAFRPRRPRCKPGHGMSTNISSESVMAVDITFGGSKEIVTSKDFKGGVVNVSFGGCEINLSQADFAEESVVLDCNISAGGLELVVPSNWEVQNEIRPTFGAIEDRRIMHTNASGEVKKKIILRGSCTCGGIEIKSF